MMKKPKQVIKWFWILLAAGAIIAFVGAELNVTVLALSGLLVMFGALVFHALFYRCPHCGSYLGRSGGTFCPFCGREIEGKRE